MRSALSTIIFRSIAGLVLSLLSAAASFAQGEKPQAINVSVITDEADAVLAILARKRASEAIAVADWQRLFSSEGYMRLKKREAAMKRPFEDEEFKAFVLSDALASRAAALAETLARWKSADVARAANLAFAYLPKEARIHAKIYPVIKPRDNSFVFDLANDPAVFLYLDPALSREKFENYLAHELHHIGYGTACPTAAVREELARLPENVRTVVIYIGAFGEGFAMLAAAGGADVHPHAVSSAVDRARWDRDIGNFNDNLKKVERFFLDLLAGRLNEQQIGETVSSFFGEQGAWYTVGWKMCALIEKRFGRQALIDAMCDQRRLLSTYNRAAADHNKKSRDRLPLWSNELIEAINKDKG